MPLDFKGAWLCLWLKILGAKVYGIGFSPNRNKKLFYSLKLNQKNKYKNYGREELFQVNQNI